MREKEGCRYTYIIQKTLRSGRRVRLGSLLRFEDQELEAPDELGVLIALALQGLQSGLLPQLVVLLLDAVDVLLEFLLVQAI